ncbi:S24 family peptidase, partial [Agrobacterium tumefaciens]|uniref:S24 family peptidase n=1 Tax=Agrobacterium tumefaciens TaxID=358 RepID=UPI003B9DE729
VRGDSMKPAIRNGWYVLVEPNGTPTPGEYVLIQLNDGRKMTKELLFKQRNGDIEVMSVNGDVRLSLHSTQIEQIHPVAAVITPSQIRYL